MTRPRRIALTHAIWVAGRNGLPSGSQTRRNRLPLVEPNVSLLEAADRLSRLVAAAELLSGQPMREAQEVVAAPAATATRSSWDRSPLAGH
jgi:hypothetical protein